MRHCRDIRLAPLLGLSCAGLVQPARAQTAPVQAAPVSPPPPQGAPAQGPLVLPRATNGNVPSGDATRPRARSIELPAAPLPQLDPVTARPLGGNVPSTDFIDQQVAAGRTRQQTGNNNQPPPVPAYVALPTIIPDPFTQPGAQTYDRALSARRLPGTTVLETLRPEFDPPGVRMGSILLHPYVSASANGDSNVYAQNDGRADAFFSGTAGFAANSDWGRHAISAKAFVQRREYARFTSEDSTSYQVTGSGRYDLSSHGSITATALSEQLVVSRSAVEELLTQARPIQFQMNGGKLAGALDYGRLQASATAGFFRTHYDNNQTATGEPLDESYRTHNSLTGQATVAYDISGLRSVYGEVDFERRRFATAGVPNNANIYSVLAGVQGGITRLIRGHIAVGYLRIAFLDPAIRDIGAPTIDADIDWLVSRRTTLSLRANRELHTVSQGNAHGALVTSLTVTAYREARRNLILSTSVQYSWSDYVDSSERANLAGVTLGASWLLDRHWRIEPGLSFSHRTTRLGDIDAEPYDVLGGLSLTYRL